MLSDTTPLSLTAGLRWVGVRRGQVTRVVEVATGTVVVCRGEPHFPAYEHLAQRDRSAIAALHDLCR